MSHRWLSAFPAVVGKGVRDSWWSQLIDHDRDLYDLSQLIVDSWSLLSFIRVRSFTNMAQDTAPAYRLSEDNVSGASSRDPDNGANIDRKLESLRSSELDLALHPNLAPSPDVPEQGWTSKMAAFSSCNLPLCLPAFCGAARRTVRRRRWRRRCRSRGQFSACTQYSLAAFCIIKGEPCRFITASIPWLVKGFPFLFQRCWHFFER